MSLIFRGKDLKKIYGMEMQTELTIENAVRDIESVEVPGRDGVVLIDNDRYKDVPFSPKFLMWKKDTFESFEEQQNAVSNFLSASYGYSDMIIWNNSNYTYSARVVDNIRINLIDEVSVEIEVNFSIKPTKYLSDSLNPVTVTNGSTLKNIGKAVSNPVITLTGTGNVTLTINSKIYVFKNINEGIVVDSENEVVTSLDGYQPQWDKAYTWPLPVLGLGDSKISWDNSAFKVSVTPRWGVLV